MDIVIKKEVARQVGYDSFIPYGISRESWQSYRDEFKLDLGKLSPTQLDDLDALLNRFAKVRGTGVLLADIKLWRSVIEQGATSQRARSVRQFETILRQYILNAPGHRIYHRHDEGAMLCYYVKSIQYHPPIEEGQNRRPAYVDVDTVFEAIGGQKESGFQFYANECLHISVEEALAAKGYQIETPELRADYLAMKELYVEVANQIGKQYWARGIAYTESGRYDDYGTRAVWMSRQGEQSRVVVDVFFEDGKAPSDRYVSLNEYFWANVRKNQSYDPYKDTDDRPINEMLDLEKEEIEVPLHPWLVCFDLQKHIRVRIHVRQLVEYVYDLKLADKLVLPQDQKNLVHLLIDTKGGMFKDIVRGKGGGAVILLSGEPGTGKTLTAEVYAESEQRPLYSVQCSQLGITPEKLEESLMRVFERAKRWNAVMLLDEADVYVHERGNNMQQNAIVGVFLRVLEYQSTILFLTTNRPEDVDDAIASRCIARLFYRAPDAKDAARIWRILADNSGLTLTDDVIEEVVSTNPEMTGRDIKNILKLAGLMEGADRGISVEQIQYVQQFKPTGKVMK